MKWLIPAKTFLVGEYAAVLGGPAIVLTTTPCFEMTLGDDNNSKTEIHPDSPAGQWWVNYQNLGKTLFWQDPYEGMGGLGASSAQFLGAYLASCHLTQREPNSQDLLEGYHQSSWGGEGLRPSGYDVLVQSQQRCVYINRQQGIMQSYDWVFEDIAFFLVHSGQKLATHSHLKQVNLPNAMHELSTIADSAHAAFENQCGEQLIAAVDAYQTALSTRGLAAQHSMEQVQALKLQKHVLTAKGCGAMGADVLLLIVEKHFLEEVSRNLVLDGWNILANSPHLYMGPKLLQNNLAKILEILS